MFIWAVFAVTTLKSKFRINQWSQNIFDRLLFFFPGLVKPGTNDLKNIVGLSLYIWKNVRLKA